MERQLIRRLFTGNFIEIVAGHFEQSARCREIHVINVKVALVALDLPREFLFRELHRLAVNTLHRHRRTLDKRPLLRQARYIQVLDGKPRIFRDAASNSSIRASGKQASQNNCHKQSNRFTYKFFHDSFSFLNSNP